MDVPPEDLQARFLVLLQQRRAREPDEHRVLQDRLHGPVQLPALRPVAFVHENEQLPVRLAGLSLQIADERLEVVHALHPELVHQRTDQPRRRLPQQRHQIPSALRPDDLLPRLGKNPFDLLVQLVPVRHHRHPGMGVVFEDPLRQQHHHDALPAALRMPDDAPLPLPHVPLGLLHREILVHPRQLLRPAVEHHEIVHQLDQPVLAARLQQVLVQLEAAIVLLVLLPLQEVLLRRADRPIPQSLRIVPRENDLHRREKPRVELRLLVRQQLPDAVPDPHPAVLQLDHPHRDPVQVQHQVRPPLLAAPQRHLLRNREVVGLRMLPIHQHDGFGDLPRLHLHRHPIAQQAIDRLVAVVQAPPRMVRLPLQPLDRPGNLLRHHAPLLQPIGQHRLLDVAVPVPVRPIPQIAIPQFIAEQRDHPFLRRPFGLADGGHLLVSALI